MFFFFKQKTAYEIYQCDWSSDVCSSDLYRRRNHIELRPAHAGMEPIHVKKGDLRIEGKVVGVMRYL